MAKEYEIFPLDPIKSLEKRVEKLESTVSGKNISHDYLELVRTNQQVVDDLVKMNAEVINKLLSLSESINNLVSKLNEFMMKFEVVGGEESETTKLLVEENKKMKTTQEELLDKLSRLEKRVNALVLSRVPIKRPVSPRRP